MSALGNFFSATFLDYLGCLVRCETELVKVWVQLNKNKAEEGRPKFDELKGRLNLEGQTR